MTEAVMVGKAQRMFDYRQGEDTNWSRALPGKEKTPETGEVPVGKAQRRLDYHQYQDTNWSRALPGYEMTLDCSFLCHSENFCCNQGSFRRILGI